MTVGPCELHEITNCSVCTGWDKAYQDTLEDSPPDDLPPLPRHPDGHPSIYSRFPGTCIGCGRRYERWTPIHHSQEHDGWVGLDCCA